MATDPQTLLAEGKCFLCFGVSDSEAMELALLAQKANKQSQQKVNLIPAGATYDQFGGYTLNGLTAGHTYTIIFGVNETRAFDGVTQIFASGTLTPPFTLIVFNGTFNAAVTAAVYA